MKIVSALALVGLAACGDNIHQSNPDAAAPDGAIDAPIDAFEECNYNEQHDTANDYLDLNTPHAVETTGLTIVPGSTRTVCGTINNGHFDTNDFSVDIDNYEITLAQDSDLLLRLTSTGDLNTYSQVGVFIGDENDAGFGGNFVLGTHAAFAIHLAAGKYHFSMEAYGDADVPTTLPYKMRIQTDTPTTRCARVTAAANYTESADGTLNLNNDVVAIDYNNNPQRELTGNPTDVPEATMLTAVADTDYRITGTSASTVTNGSYFDRDTYLFTAGPTTNEMSVRLNWPGQANDLDFYVFSEGVISVPVANASTMKLGEDEFTTFSVKPGAKYWLWVGGFNSSTALPTTYDASICPTMFTSDTM